MAGRGRGRGRGGPLVVARDDEGNAVELGEGPPSLFPAITLPPRPDLDQVEPRDERRRQRYASLLRFWRQSPYHLEDRPQLKAAGPIRKLGGQLRRQQAEEQRGKETALASLLTLTPHYFPAELYSSKDERASTRASTWVPAQQRDDDAGLRLLDHLTRLEVKSAAAAGGDEEADAEKKAAEKREKGEEQEEDEAEADVDDVDDEDDDYYQNDTFDDDEGYDDPYGDDADEGPVY